MRHRRFAEDYEASIKAYVNEPDESGLFAGYQLGRRAVTEDIGLLDFLTIHHEALSQIFKGGPSSRAALMLAARFVTQGLASFEMLQRAVQDTAKAARQQARYANVIRKLSTLLADASLAHEDEGSLREMLNLVAEQGRELVSADRCTIEIYGVGSIIEASDPPAGAHPQTAGGDAAVVQAAFIVAALDGKKLGVLTAQRAHPSFTDADHAVLEHLAQMVAAAVDRHFHYIK
jgi:hypothetical protein